MSDVPKHKPPRWMEYGLIVILIVGALIIILALLVPVPNHGVFSNIVSQLHITPAR